MLALKVYLLVGAVFTTSVLYVARPEQKQKIYEEWNRNNDFGPAIFWFAILVVGTLFWPLMMASFIKNDM